MERNDPQVGPDRAQEAGPARAVGPDHGTRRQAGHRTGRAQDQSIARIRSSRVGRDHEVELRFDRNVLGAVDGEIDLARTERRFEGPDERAFAPRRVGPANVAGCDDDHQLDVDAGSA